jgi:hypothetical protein
MFSVLLGRDEDYRDMQNHDIVLKPSTNTTRELQVSSGGTVTGSVQSIARVQSMAMSSMSF